MQRLVVWGAGELGARVAAAWCAAGADVLAATASSSRHAALRAAGATPSIGSPCEQLAPSDALLLALPGTALQRAAVDSLGSVRPPRRAVFISSTGFHAGAFGPVDETAEPGVGARAGAIAACERAFLDWAGAAGVVLRCGGLWRRGRGPAEALRRDRRAPPGPPDRTLALVHYDDAAAAALAALRHANPASVYLCVTPPCPDRRTFYATGAAALGLTPPQFEAPTGQPRLEFVVTRLRRDLLAVPASPDWRAAFEL